MGNTRPPRRFIPLLLAALCIGPPALAHTLNALCATAEELGGGPLPLSPSRTIVLSADARNVGMQLDTLFIPQQTTTVFHTELGWNESRVAHERARAVRHLARAFGVAEARFVTAPPAVPPTLWPCERGNALAAAAEHVCAFPRCAPSPAAGAATAGAPQPSMEEDAGEMAKPWLDEGHSHGAAHAEEASGDHDRQDADATAEPSAEEHHHGSSFGHDHDHANEHQEEGNDHKDDHGYGDSHGSGHADESDGHDGPESSAAPTSSAAHSGHGDGIAHGGSSHGSGHGHSADSHGSDGHGDHSHGDGHNHDHGHGGDHGHDADHEGHGHGDRPTVSPRPSPPSCFALTPVEFVVSLLTVADSQSRVGSPCAPVRVVHLVGWIATARRAHGTHGTVSSFTGGDDRDLVGYVLYAAFKPARNGTGSGAVVRIAAERTLRAGSHSGYVIDASAAVVRDGGGDEERPADATFAAGDGRIGRAYGTLVPYKEFYGLAVRIVLTLPS